MNDNSIKRYLLLCLIFSSLSAREIRTPLSLHKGYPLRYSFFVLSCNEKQDEEEKYDTEKKWGFDVWAQGYDRSAKQAYCCNQTDCSDCCGQKKNCCPLTQLFFGKSDFKGSDVFPEGAIPTLNLDPFVSISTLSPRVRYKEHGALIGFVIQRDINESYRLGLRTQLPIRSVRVEYCKSPGEGSSLFGGENINDVTATKTETVNGNVVNSFIYRMDLLDQLPLSLAPVHSNVPLVNYRNTDLPGNPITIVSQDVTDNPVLGQPPDNRCPVTVVKSSSGQVPSGNFAIPVATAVALPDLSRDGSSLADGGRAKFVFNRNYSPLKDANLAQLWIGPSVGQGIVGGALVNGIIVDPARVIRDHVNDLLKIISRSTEEFFEKKEIFFSEQKHHGVGDLDLDLFAQCNFCDSLSTEFNIGWRFPTAEKVNIQKYLFRQPLGNNGHHEVKIGVYNVWQPVSRLEFAARVSHSWVLKACETVAAPFRNATVKNIGLPLSADIAWRYWIFGLDAAVRLGSTYNVGIDVGYELYSKRRDRVTSMKEFAQDLFGNEQVTDCSLLIKGTAVTAHKAHIEGFWFSKRYGWVNFQLFSGYSAVVGGKNTFKDRDWYVGVNISF